MNPAHEEHYDKAAVREVVEAHKTQLRSCYERESKANPQLKGTLRMTWSIDDSGSVVSVAVDGAKSDFRNARMEACLTDQIKAWKFLPAPPRNEVDVTYPFKFSN